MMDNITPISGLSRSLMELIIVSDIEGSILYASPHNETVSGWDLEDEVGGSVFEHVHPDDMERVRQVFFTSIQNSHSGQAEFRYQRPDGNYLHLETISNPLCLGQKVIGAILTSHYISDKIHPKDFTFPARDMYAKAFRFNPDPITISTINEGRYIMVNEAFCRQTGYSREEVIGRTAGDLGIVIFPNDRDNVVDFIRQQGPLLDIERQFISQPGDIRVGLMSLDIIEIGGQPHLLSIIKDITERKRLEQEVLLLEERFYKAFNASPIMMCISTVEEGICIDANDSFYRVTGFSRDQVLGKRLLDLDIWEIPICHSMGTDASNGSRSISECESSIRTCSGSQRSCLYSAEKIDVTGEECILSILVDITERKQMEREMTRMDQLNLVGQIAVNMGHEIRNPMTTVRGYLQLLRQQQKYSDEYEAFDLMIEEIDRSNAIISEFISLAHDKYVQLKPLDLNMIITDLLPLLQANAHAQEKYIKADIEALPRLLLDKKEIRQMIINLAQNGLEAMASGGTLRISSSVRGRDVVLAIQDEGSGMSDEVRDKLGTPFFTTKDDRTGLGLAVCFGIARRHNAVIQYKTDETGTTAEVVLPVDLN